ncbi:MAG: hypothetical protein Ct9H90mP4_10720 [Gammaproteobacteria bacterium]|nr:MAG: hypothetical protein Ct9H90mP4_10720 [Gammaproteobacteria bacterium]
MLTLTFDDKNIRLLRPASKHMETWWELLSHKANTLISPFQRTGDFLPLDPRIS